MESAGSYDEAVKRASDAVTPGPSYFIIAGTKPGQGVIITRDRMSTRDIWRLSASNGTSVEFRDIFTHHSWKLYMSYCAAANCGSCSILICYVHAAISFVVGSWWKRITIIGIRRHLWTEGGTVMHRLYCDGYTVHSCTHTENNSKCCMRTWYFAWCFILYRQVAENGMKKLGQNQINAKNLFQVLSLHPVLNG